MVAMIQITLYSSVLNVNYRTMVILNLRLYLSGYNDIFWNRCRLKGHVQTINIESSVRSEYS